MSDANTSPDVSALVDALDARARQAGTDGAATLVRGVIGTLSESLVAIDDRLDRIEGSVTGDPTGSQQSLDAVASNLTSLNARLARLEEAFVQALEESGDGAVAVVDQVRAAIVELLPPATAGDDGRADAERRLTEGIGAISGRLDGFESMLHEHRRQLTDGLAAIENAPPIEIPLPPAPPPVDLTPITAALDSIGNRLRALEEREPPQPAPVEIPPFPEIPAPVDVAPVLAALGDVASRLRALEEKPPPPPVEIPPYPEIPPFPEIPAFPEPTPPVDLEPVIDRLRVLDGRIAAIEAKPEPKLPELPPPPPPVDLRPVISDALAPVLARLSQLDEQVTRLADAPAPTLQAATDPEVFERLDAIAEAVRRDEGSAKVIAAVEERLTSAIRAITDRVAGTVSDIAALRDHRDSLGKRLDEFGGALTGLRVEVDRAAPASVAHEKALEALRGELRTTDQRWPAVQTAEAEVQRVVADLSSAVAGIRPLLDAQRGAVERLEAGLRELGDRIDRSGDTDVSTTAAVSKVEAEVKEQVRREAEMLTQRVASLAVGVEATRVLCEQLADAYEQSIGRKAGEVGRRLAEDLGLRSRRSSSGRTDRELGPGSR